MQSRFVCSDEFPLPAREADQITLIVPIVHCTELIVPVVRTPLRILMLERE